MDIENNKQDRDYPLEAPNPGGMPPTIKFAIFMLALAGLVLFGALVLWILNRPFGPFVNLTF